MAPATANTCRPSNERCRSCLPAGRISSSTWLVRTPTSKISWAGCASTYEGLRGRDYLVLSSARDAGVPAVIVFAGGYARRVEDTAAIHIATIEEAVRLGA